MYRVYKVFQRRQNGVVDFYEGWQNYTDGFGNLDGEFWLGSVSVYSIMVFIYGERNGLLLIL